MEAEARLGPASEPVPHPAGEHGTPTSHQYYGVSASTWRSACLALPHLPAHTCWCLQTAPPGSLARLHGRLRLPESGGRPGCFHPRTRKNPAARHLHSILSVILDSALGPCHCCCATGTQQAF